ncbi:unnamed protein product [Rotaria sp. Silwood2]|nr:unnamed protein product [Rotaria sp. Silwood2]CAF3494217.1 unnamed protein product [Rotaria sp. Silwood2]CAF4306232.1 unnamed protein product [Rotaria sp. Silwood2]CAF4687923.1 unnamed protein product [Rotaria sp. Silwood2]
MFQVKKTNCGYNAIQKILNDRGIDKSIDNLRNNRAQNIEDNPQQFLKVVQAQRWIESHHLQVVNCLLIVGGAKREASFEEILIAGTYPLANNYKDLSRKLSGRKRTSEINHIPPKASYKGISYENVDIDNMLAMVVFVEDHQATTSTGSSEIVAGYYEIIPHHMREGNIYDAIKVELNDMLNNCPTRRFYEDNARQYIDYIASTSMRNASLYTDGTTIPIKKV